MFRNDVPITPELVRQHGLTPDEYARFRALIGRDPTLTELGIVSAMWNEHCSYKSSRKHLRGLPTTAPWVIQGPGENAGVIDIGDGLACVFKMESHNHPSFIEPYQGAATGVGGILRDVFTMGARPIAALNALRFGSPDHPRTRHLVSGVVAGVGGYGNSFGVPTVGGLVGFHSRYDGNILVNAMAVGLAKTDAIFYAAATGVGNPIVYLGSKTGRDGIHGATMASAEFDAETEAKRPTVQVGDPFAEKLLLEACLELMASGAVIAIQDMGAAGLTCSAVEMGAKGDLGVELDLDAVPVREEGMTPYEMMLSESQERMLVVLKPGMEDEAKAIFVKWGLDFAIIGHTTDTLRFVVKWHGETMADLPIKELGDEAPLYDRPHIANTHQPVIAAADVPATVPHAEALKRLIGSPELASKRWVYEQYDHFILGNTIQKPGGDAAIVRVEDGPKGLAITADVTPRYCEADPVQGGRQAVAEAWRNITAVGGRPLAITDNLNFGNPEKPEVMGQLVGCLKGIGEACLALDFPVVSGNVSLYNETNGVGILPTPTIGGVGVLDDVAVHATIALKRAGDVLVLLGRTEGWLGQSQYLAVIAGREEGAPPPVDLAGERKTGDFVRGLITSGAVDTVHDLSDGGLAVALAEMSIASGIGATVPEAPAGIAAHAWLFGEDQGRYLLAVSETVASEILSGASAQGIAAARIGTTGGDGLTLPDSETISVADLRAAHEDWFPAYMASQPAAPAA
ncbi:MULTISPECIES: phosphoribosylformylglycinamidine synthase subunit PurL [Methylobacterium]|uniref:Phosphoribosylformylglycinamidine synthase subunit PurL n=1 Tax=Methylobacterium thuringiense TaxID=1003091 RepID=A0ABQ4TEI7_9HYPH|nr:MULTISPECIES: phosphoribosylformylglycinamidine synthase subunit PurL [Methylobacterium]TXN24303.1 phosphoribosylformylglycinamidine synthase subunit PurL [Methylobacterium sp. WL9]GJE53785.1 Phosphoribosylformylglycinamidine synthase subunit PurL [Methylobacterium thuringiense]